MTSVTDFSKKGLRTIPPANLALSPLRSVGLKLFGYLLVPSTICLVLLAFPLFNSRVEETKGILLSAAEQEALKLNSESGEILDQSDRVRGIYEGAIDRAIPLETVLKDSDIDSTVLQQIKQLKEVPPAQAGITDRGGSIAIIDGTSDKKLLYAHSDSENNSQVSFTTIPRLNRVVASITDQASGTRSLEGSVWAYTKIGNTGWIVVSELPESTGVSSVWSNLFLALAGIVIASGFTALVLVVDLRGKFQIVVDACEQLERGTTQTFNLEDNSDEIGQVQQALARAVQIIALREEQTKEQMADSIRQEERQNLRKDQDQEAEFLESEIGSLLDVVSALEDGDLTIQAEVSDRATGLVADTLNRLREQLAQIIAGVLGAAQKVADGASGLEVAARTVSENVVNQAQSVAQGRALTEQVAELAQNSTTMVRESSQSLETIEATVVQGQGAINSLTDSIGVLQEGTAQIIQRMKTLGEFVGLAEQFVQDQGQIASLTQVLAINATLVAARAAEQRDPKQFIGVAREFEAIAGQVNTLATQTNDGLGVLQQRTAQIQSVVSAIDVEVQGLGRLVEGFTKGVDKSQTAFNDVQLVTAKVVATGQQVSESSNDIAIAAESTARYISEIATLAEQTADLTADARTQAEIMGALAQQLLAGIRYFRLPIGLLPEQKS